MSTRLELLKRIKLDNDRPQVKLYDPAPVKPEGLMIIVKKKTGKGNELSPVVTLGGGGGLQVKVNGQHCYSQHEYEDKEGNGVIYFNLESYPELDHFSAIVRAPYRLTETGPDDTLVFSYDEVDIERVELLSK